VNGTFKINFELNSSQKICGSRNGVVDWVVVSEVVGVVVGLETMVVDWRVVPVDVPVVVGDVEIHLSHCAGQSRSTLMLLPSSDSTTVPHLSFKSVRQATSSCLPLQKKPVVAVEVMVDVIVEVMLLD